MAMPWLCSGASVLLSRYPDDIITCCPDFHIADFRLNRIPSFPLFHECFCGNGGGRKKAEERA